MTKNKRAKVSTKMSANYICIFNFIFAKLSFISCLIPLLVAHENMSSCTAILPCQQIRMSWISSRYLSSRVLARNVKDLGSNPAWTLFHSVSFAVLSQVQRKFSNKNFKQQKSFWQVQIGIVVIENYIANFCRIAS